VLVVSQKERKKKKEKEKEMSLWSQGSFLLYGINFFNQSGYDSAKAKAVAKGLFLSSFHLSFYLFRTHSVVSLRCLRAIRRKSLMLSLISLIDCMIDCFE